MAEEEIEYESDPEEAKLSLKMRRREASDDEEEAEEGEDRREKPLRRIDESDGESEGAAAEYEEELEDEEEDYDLDEEYVEEEEIEEAEYEARGDDGAEMVAVGREESGKEGVFEEEQSAEKKGFDNDVGNIDDGKSNVADGQGEEERKKVEPFSVPTAGTFYMHDDRFRGNAGGRHRRTLVGRKLWESKDDRKWGHDKFEELTMQERHHEEGRRGSRGRFRGRRRNRGLHRGSPGGNRPKEYPNRTQNNNNQSSAPKGARRRGPRRYQPSFKNNIEAPNTQNKSPGKSVEKNSNNSSRRTGEPLSNAKPDVVLPRKQITSNLSISSPPFYPTGSSTEANSAPPKRDVQSGIVNRTGQQSLVDEKFSTAHGTSTMRAKNIVDSIGLDNLSIGDSPSVMSGKPSNRVQMPISGSLSMNHVHPQLRGQGRGPASFTQMAYQPAVSSNQLNRVPPPSQLRSVQRNPIQSRAQSSPQGPVQQLTQLLPRGTQLFSPPKTAGTVNIFEPAELESASELNQSKTALVAKGKENVQGSGKGSFLYGGAQVMGASGNMGSGHNDQNFPAFLPVMQFGGQHPGGIGVPAVGMAFPGYVAQPQLGLESSEMTWLPVLAGAAGALGSSYRPPYVSADGSYNTRLSGQTSSVSSASSKKNNAAKVGNDLMPAHRPELANNDSGQRQKNPRRYTEMKFDQ